MKDVTLQYRQQLETARTDEEFEDFIEQDAKRHPPSIGNAGMRLNSAREFELQDMGDAYETQIYIRIPKSVVERST